MYFLNIVLILVWETRCWTSQWQFTITLGSWLFQARVALTWKLFNLPPRADCHVNATPLTEMLIGFKVDDQNLCRVARVYLCFDRSFSFIRLSRTSSCSTWNTFPRCRILTIGNPFWSVQTFIIPFMSIFPLALAEKRQELTEKNKKELTTYIRTGNGNFFFGLFYFFDNFLYKNLHCHTIRHLALH